VEFDILISLFIEEYPQGLAFPCGVVLKAIHGSMHIDLLLLFIHNTIINLSKSKDIYFMKEMKDIYFMKEMKDI